MIRVHIGRDLFRGRGWHLIAAAVRRKNPIPGELAYRFHMELRWDFGFYFNRVRD